jgi:hypothetical protein
MQNIDHAKGIIQEVKRSANSSANSMKKWNYESA